LPRVDPAPVLVLVLVLASVLAPACRVGTTYDALISPFPDGTTDVPSDSPAPPCSLLLQDCPNKQACYPSDTAPGTTVCSFAGSAPPSSPCTVDPSRIQLSSSVCDLGEACVFVDESQITECATLCDPSKAQTGCQRGAPCRMLPGYAAGFCVP
jgi:hypothetical protein